jgi:hypothetical protein
MERIYTFSENSDVKDWKIVNDGVMGGISSSSLQITKEGYGHFSGKVSLENNGGFASVQWNTNIPNTKNHSHIVLQIKGDGKKYEFRIKENPLQPEAYVQPFASSGVWETIKLKIVDFYPQYRGRKLNIGNFKGENIQQISFLIANKREEKFDLWIDWIGME